jgi:hypothetical protein
MSRPTSKPLLMVDRLITVLEEDVALHPELWFTTPRTMTRNLNASVRDAERPLVAIEFGKREPLDAGVSDGGVMTRWLQRLTGWLEVDGTEDPQAAGNELASDFSRFLGRHPQLEGEDGEAFIDCGRIHDLGSEPAFDFDATSGGALIQYDLAIEFYSTAVDA